MTRILWSRRQLMVAGLALGSQWAAAQDGVTRNSITIGQSLALTGAAASLALFAWLLTLHPAASGRIYAAYGGVYIGVAILWLWLVDKVTPSASDLIGVAVCFVGMAIIMWGPRQA